MDEIYYEKILNRIIQGRLRIRLGDLVLFIDEPSNHLVEESFEIYEDTYNKAYFSGVYVDQEIVELLLENDLWSPFDDRAADELEKKIEDLKVEAFQNYYNRKKLIGIKRQIKSISMQIGKYRHKKKQLDHVTCRGVANFARQCWIISKTTKNVDGTDFDFNKVPITKVLETYSENTIDVSAIRRVARTEPWRVMWIASIRQGNAFGSKTSDLDKNQLALISLSQMYDNVYEAPECPKQEIIDDDDCLDGWFIFERRKREKEKKQREADNLVSNPKIANSQEIFLMAGDQEQAREIGDLNTDHAKMIVKQRNQQIEQAESGQIHFKNLTDVQQERHIAATQAGIAQTKSRGR